MNSLLGSPDISTCPFYSTLLGNTDPAGWVRELAGRTGNQQHHLHWEESLFCTGCCLGQVLPVQMTLWFGASSSLNTFYWRRFLIGAGKKSG